MRVATIKLFTVALMCCAVGVVQAKGDGFEVGVGVTYFDFDKRWAADDELGFGVNAGYRLGRYFAVEAAYDAVATKLDDDDFDIEHYYGSGLFYFLGERRLKPFIKAGYGQVKGKVRRASGDANFYVLGAGVKWPLGTRFTMGVQAQRYFNDDNADEYTTFGCTLSYAFDH